jgi:methylase of polypeptide subunit release factors
MNGTNKAEFGDFQTPPALAGAVTGCLKDRGLNPQTVVEPTCGVGQLLHAATRTFPSASRFIGREINPYHVEAARKRVPEAVIERADFFREQWQDLIAREPRPTLILGNPPWVTASALAINGSTNLPAKANFQGLRGLDAKTGKANFDIAEWMLIRLIEAAGDQDASIAMLVKTAVARKVLVHLWKTSTKFRGAAIYPIDAAKAFNVAVSACLFVCDLGGNTPAQHCDVYKALGERDPNQRIGWDDGHIIADADARRASLHLEADPADNSRPRWRSGVKHDCAKVMEFTKVGSLLFNGHGEEVDLEPSFLFPLLKGSDVARDRAPSRWMLVPQRHTGQETAILKEVAPKTWEYLQQQGQALDRRKSSIYRNRPRFSVFGVGDYTFTPWKIAICGLYKSLDFRLVGPHHDRPVVFDDTTYVLAFANERQARAAVEALRSDQATTFFRAAIFWDNKRPITAEVLNRLDLFRLLSDDDMVSFAAAPPNLFA